MEYQLVIPQRVQKEIEKIDSRYKQRILAAFVSLKNDPRLGKKLDGEYQGQWSLRVWPYRIIYEIKNKELVILIIRVRHRQGVY
jgi:mRNA interferase RelE/StbE